MENWYIVQNGQQIGPISKQQLLNFGLNADSMVWHEGMADWQKASDVESLSDLLYASQYAKAEQNTQNFDPYPSPGGKSKIAAGVLAILLGGFGVQYFYLGKVGGGLLTILLTIVTCGLWEIITLIQGILMLTMSDEEFARKFVYTTKTFPLF